LKFRIWRYTFWINNSFCDFGIVAVASAREIHDVVPGNLEHPCAKVCLVESVPTADDPPPDLLTNVLDFGSPDPRTYKNHKSARVLANKRGQGFRIRLKFWCHPTQFTDGRRFSSTSKFFLEVRLPSFVVIVARQDAALVTAVDSRAASSFATGGSMSGLTRRDAVKTVAAVGTIATLSGLRNMAVAQDRKTEPTGWAKEGDQAFRISAGDRPVKVGQGLLSDNCDEVKDDIRSRFQVYEFGSCDHATPADADVEAATYCLPKVIINGGVRNTEFGHKTVTHKVNGLTYHTYLAYAAGDR
jgi:hypothetical protein